MPNSDAQSLSGRSGATPKNANRPQPRAIRAMELGGLEPPTSWVRSSPTSCETPWLRRMKTAILPVFPLFSVSLMPNLMPKII